jgi:hypothetical protein
VLAAHGAAKVSAYVTHGIFPNKSYEKFKPDNGGMYLSLASKSFSIVALLFFIFKAPESDQTI